MLILLVGGVLLSGGGDFNKTIDWSVVADVDAWAAAARTAVTSLALGLGAAPVLAWRASSKQGEERGTTGYDYNRQCIPFSCLNVLSY